MSAEFEADVAVELGTNCNLGKTIASVCPAWRCPHQTDSAQTVDNSQREYHRWLVVILKQSWRREVGRRGFVLGEAFVRRMLAVARQIPFGEQGSVIAACDDLLETQHVSVVGGASLLAWRCRWVWIWRLKGRTRSTKSGGHAYC
jgi:hypothetical protein